jgi:hypothetical protein
LFAKNISSNGRAGDFLGDAAQAVSFRFIGIQSECIKRAGLFRLGKGGKADGWMKKVRWF